jgi:hypothetical protein
MLPLPSPSFPTLALAPSLSQNGDLFAEGRRHGAEAQTGKVEGERMQDCRPCPSHMSEIPPRGTLPCLAPSHAPTPWLVPAHAGGLTDGKSVSPATAAASHTSDPTGLPRLASSRCPCMCRRRGTGSGGTGGEGTGREGTGGEGTGGEGKTKTYLHSGRQERSGKDLPPRAVPGPPAASLCSLLLSFMRCLV